MARFEGRLDVDSGIDIYYQLLKSDKTLPWLIITHGVSEYSGRYYFFEDYFKDHFNILFYDLRGHGKSDGKRGDIDSFEIYSDDLKKMIQFLESFHEMKSYVLFSHSMGALITANFIQNFPLGIIKPDKVFLSAPPIRPGGGLGESTQILPKSLIDKLAGVSKSFKLKNLIPDTDLTNHQQGDLGYDNDELILDGISTRLLFNLVKTGREVGSKPLKADFPIYCAIGGKDKVVSKKALSKYLDKHGKDVYFMEFINGKHELHNEIEEIKKPYMTYLQKTLT